MEDVSNNLSPVRTVSALNEQEPIVLYQDGKYRFVQLSEGLPFSSQVYH